MKPETPYQLEFFAPATPGSIHTLHEFLNVSACIPICVKVTKNRVSLLSVEFAVHTIKVRVHEQFLQAPPSVWNDLRIYLRSRRRDAWKRLDLYIQSLPVDPRRTRKELLRAKGKVHNLSTLKHKVNQTYFNNRLSCDICWGKRSHKRRKRRRTCIRFGSYHAREKLIVIHPSLDQETVPSVFLEYVIYHEMLHAVVPAVIKNNRWCTHPPLFRKLERAFPGYKEMQQLSSDLLAKL